MASTPSTIYKVVMAISYHVYVKRKYFRLCHSTLILLSMADDRLQIKQGEMALLAEAYKEHPEQFTARTYIDDAETLGGFGIHIPGKEHFVSGTLKLWPEDFIVEEIGGDGTHYSADTENTPHTDPGPAPTVYATLVKCGLSTLEATDDIARQLGIKKEAISFAGIKDKDALTSQRISLRGVRPEKVVELHSSYFFLKDIAGGKGVVEKGSLRGNRFSIFVRTEENPGEGEASQHIARALQAVTEKGFYNFFYLQRFGTPRLRNYYWARHILRGEYEAAVLDILTYPAPRELEYFKILRGKVQGLFGQWSAVEAELAPFPHIFIHELKIVRHLIEHPTDFAGALREIPEQITLWMYALTSLLYNELLSEYVRTGKEVPERLPFFLSPKPEDSVLYRPMLENLGLYPVPLQNLRQFPFIQIRSRSQHTRDHATIRKGEVREEGVLLQFDLAKGQYATTFLSHIFNLTSGVPPMGIRKNRIDTKQLLGEPSVLPALERFKDVIHPKGENVFENMLQKGE